MVPGKKCAVRADLGLGNPANVAENFGDPMGTARKLKEYLERPQQPAKELNKKMPDKKKQIIPASKHSMKALNEGIQ